MKENTLIPHLFRTEYSKIVAVLCKRFGLYNIEMAEDIASETFLVATETWSLKGVPKNPKAWLYAVAKNKTKDYLKRNQLFLEKISPQLSTSSKENVFEIKLTEKNILDSQLQMIFAVCNPIISAEAQIALALRLLCGFGINEIAQAFLSNKETINKRLQRAKKKLKEENVSFDFPPKKELENRLEKVLSVIYLLFNEGYYSQNSEKQLRKELCIEAVRLCYMLVSYSATNVSQSNALMSLLCFHSSRFEARQGGKEALILYEDQDQNLWDDKLIAKGEKYLNASAEGIVSKYHLEAMISFWHTRKKPLENKWENILQLYNKLLCINYSPIIALNRTYAFSKARSKKEALIELAKIDLKGHYMYHLLAGELNDTINVKKQISHLNKAYQLVKSETEKRIIKSKLEKILLN